MNLLKKGALLAALIICGLSSNAQSSDTKFATVIYPRFFQLQVPVVDNKIDWKFEVTSSYPINTIFYYDDLNPEGIDVSDMLPQNGDFVLDNVNGENPQVVFSLSVGNRNEKPANTKFDNGPYKVYVKNDRLYVKMKDGSAVPAGTSVILTNYFGRILYKLTNESDRDNGIPAFSPGVYNVYVGGTTTGNVGDTGAVIEGARQYNVCFPNGNPTE